jgi:hypothetical protein
MTPQQAAAQLKAINVALAQGINNAEVAALQSGLGEYLGRVFNDGQASDGSSMGGYSEQHRKKRQTPRSAVKVRQIKTGPRAGQQVPSQKTLQTYPLSPLQVGYKDLQFFGDLFNGIVTGTSQGANVLGFLRDADRVKMQGTEDYIQKDVIKLSETEKDTIDDTFKALIDDIIKQA